MQNRKQLINELKGLLSRKQSREYYAKRLNVTVAEINDMLAEIHGHSSEETSNTKRLNLEKGEVEVSSYWTHEPTTDEVIKQHNIDTTQYSLSQYWSKQKSKGYQVSACFKALKKDKDYLQDQFIKFLGTYKPVATPIAPFNFIEFEDRPMTCLILNLQDAHYNKMSLKGNNDMQKRFNIVQSKIHKLVTEAAYTSNLNKIVYTIGSDIFNSEWTGFTTHGTPQTNLTDHYSSFEAICEHEIAVIDFLLSSTQDLEVFYVPGNHDQYVGWSLIKWLQAYYRKQSNLHIHAEPSFTKYMKFGNTAVCFNHGYKIKPEDLVHNFAAQFKEYSSCKHRVVFTGDKHTEHSRVIGGCKFFRIGTISNAVSNWDEEMGYDNQNGEMTAFLIDEVDGMTRTFYEPIKY